MLERIAFLDRLELPEEIRGVLAGAASLKAACSAEEISELCVPGDSTGWHDVAYDVAGRGMVREAYVCRARNGICANYFEPYMRRRDPDSMLIGDDLPTDKIRYRDAMKQDFSVLRSETLNWLKGQDLLAFVFRAGQYEQGIPGLAVAPANAAFFALGLAELQGVLDLCGNIPRIKPRCFIFVAPPFRHTHFGGKQRVVHRRAGDDYEIFSYNLYPGPSAKKGVYGALIHFAEREGWCVNHAAVAQVVTPYDNKITIMHEGASGGGKSEMNEHIHRDTEGNIVFGRNIVTGEQRLIVLPRSCTLRPVTDDMAVCPPQIQKKNGKLTVQDAENGWFIRVDHIKNYGTDPDVEARSIHPEQPLVFLNIDAQPQSTALLWDHIPDQPDKPCPNPRFIMPRSIVPGVVSRPVSVDIRSFGVRTPPCTRERPTYGVIGIFHVLPPALAWIWRLVAPRGDDNPSIVSGPGKTGLEAEGVGSYWPFAAGRRVPQANLLLRQIVENPKVHYILTPVRHIGSWQTGFNPEWIMREYLARRGGVRFERKELTPSRSPLLGYALNKLVIEGQSFDLGFLQTDHQPEVGPEAFDAGAAMLKAFFDQELKTFLEGDLVPEGRAIIDCVLSGGSLADLEGLMPGDSVFFED